MKGMVSSVKNKFFTRKFVPAQGAKSTCKVCRCRKGMGINMKKKRISTVLFSIMCFCMLAGCADNEQEKVTDTQLEQQRGENFELEAGQEVLPGNENEEEQNQMQEHIHRQQTHPAKGQSLDFRQRFKEFLFQKHLTVEIHDTSDEESHSIGHQKSYHLPQLRKDKQ